MKFTFLFALLLCIASFGFAGYAEAATIPNGASTLSLSATTATLTNGQNLSIGINGGSGGYAVFNNSNPAAVVASISGSALALRTGTASGSASITVCTTDLSACGVVTVTAAGASTLTFSPSAPVVSVGTNQTVNISGASGAQYYISGNATPSVVQVGVSGTALTLVGVAPGTSSITVCPLSGTCGTLSVTVVAASSSGAPTLSPNTLHLLASEIEKVTIVGGNQPYSVQGGASSLVVASVSGSTLTVVGQDSSGTTSMSVCSSGGGCATLNIVLGTGEADAATTFGISQNPVVLSANQGTVISFSGIGGYYLSNSPNRSIASISMNGSDAAISAFAPGNTSATVCQSDGTCGTLSINVLPASTTASGYPPGCTASTVYSTTTGQSCSTTTTTSPVTPPTTTTAPPVATIFTKNLAPGSQDAEVMVLQKLLASLGYLTATPNGYFGPATTKAVIAFQAAHGISQLGVVGPTTRVALNAAESIASPAGSSSSSSVANMTLSELKATLQTLQAQLAQVSSRITQLSQ